MEAFCVTTSAESLLLQYGLVAEEVAKIYPELVSYGPDGKLMTVRYSMLSDAAQ